MLPQLQNQYNNSRFMKRVGIGIEYPCSNSYTIAYNAAHSYSNRYQKNAIENKPAKILYTGKGTNTLMLL